MINQLKELLEMQKVLDNNIFREKGIKQYPKENMQVALFVELGELLNELPTRFKHWKSSAVDNREKALVEYVDCLHFALSLTNDNGLEFSNDLSLSPDVYNYNSHEITLLAELPVHKLLKNIIQFEGNLSYLFGLGVKLGFEWDEIYNAYKDKNAINYERLRGGY
jgi:dimeric dUTPase (all-alpha-NTP-PPase superfamily)